MKQMNDIQTDYRYVVVAKNNGDVVTLLETSHDEEGMAKCVELQKNLAAVMGLNTTICWRKK